MANKSATRPLVHSNLPLLLPTLASAASPPYGDGDQGDQALSRYEIKLFSNADNQTISDVRQMKVQDG